MELDDEMELSDKMSSFTYNPYFISGGDQDHRQDEAGRGEPGEGAARGGGDEAAGPPLHHPALPGDPFN